MKRITMGLGLSLLAAGSFATELVLPKLLGVRVEAVVQTNQSLHDFRYRLTHGGAADILPVCSAFLDVSSDASRLVLDQSRLPLTNGYFDGGVKAVLRHYPPSAFVAVGGIGFPAGWNTNLTMHPFVRWSAPMDAQLAPGQSAELSLRTEALPGIRSLKLEADQYPNLPILDHPSNPQGYDTQDVGEAEEAAAQVIRTLGPVAPPATFEPLAFLQEIEGYWTEAKTLGWVRQAAVGDQIDQALAEIQEELRAASPSTARQRIEAVTTLVEQHACPDLPCDPAAALSTEAGALLRYNLAYLHDHLEVPASAKSANTQKTE